MNPLHAAFESAGARQHGRRDRPAGGTGSVIVSKPLSTSTARYHCASNSCEQALCVGANVLDLFGNGGQLAAIPSSSIRTKLIVKFISMHGEIRNERLGLGKRQSSEEAGRQVMKSVLRTLGAKRSLFQGGDTRATAIRDALLMAYEEVPEKAEDAT